jgi:preprotein translocase subunit SecA
MQTGEGKTLVAALPAFVHALGGGSVHVMTTNTYLAQRDFTLLAPVFELLGQRAGLLIPGQSRDEKRRAYQCQVVYGPGYEFGFDYLRDRLAGSCGGDDGLGEGVVARLSGQEVRRPRSLQHERAFAVIDEADSVMIDEANTPLLLSAAPGNMASAAAQVYRWARESALGLEPRRHYILDFQRRSATLTRCGIDQIASAAQQAATLGLERPWACYVEQALQVEYFLRRDADYTLRENVLHIVDQATGRIFADRFWRDGLHQAVQAKEGIAVSAEPRPLARMTRQRFFRLYGGLCGMTGTVIGSEREFREIYGLPVTSIPTNRPCQRKEHATRYFAAGTSRWQAVVEEIRELHAGQRPILIGTCTIDESEQLAEILRRQKIAFQLLNGKQDASEAETIARAGQRGAVTIATNMAGRGTDIRLGPGVAELGGLHVIACQRHESRRVDRQLAGRAARQGDPGSVRFFVAADDPLVREQGQGLAGRLQRCANPDGQVGADFGRHVAAAQRRAERARRRQRRQLAQHDDWLERVTDGLLGG